MDFLFSDPRPDAKQDTLLWSRLLHLIPKMEDKKTAYLLQRKLWTIRSIGTMLRASPDGLKFVPMIGEENWSNQAEFEEIKRKYLGPYAKEIAELLRKVVNP